MGTEISLEVGAITVDWGKNMRGSDHRPLYQERDRKRLICNQIDDDASGQKFGDLFGGRNQLGQQDDLAKFFTKKVQAAQIHKTPYIRPHDGQGQGTS